MLVISIRIQLFKGRIWLVGRSGKQQNLGIGSLVIEKFVGQHGLLIITLFEQRVEALELIHDNQIRIEHVYTDPGKNTTQFVNQICSLPIVATILSIFNQLIDNRI